MGQSGAHGTACDIRRTGDDGPLYSFSRGWCRTQAPATMSTCAGRQCHTRPGRKRSPHHRRGAHLSGKTRGRFSGGASRDAGSARLGRIPASLRPSSLLPPRPPASRAPAIATTGGAPRTPAPFCKPARPRGALGCRRCPKRNRPGRSSPGFLQVQRSHPLQEPSRAPGRASWCRPASRTVCTGGVVGARERLQEASSSCVQGQRAALSAATGDGRRAQCIA